ncbi:polyhydroxyalkanoate synthase [Limimonas halophila]|uniref:Polyhydroxyalkanoate synthase n=1 Tax=Limimonas halophila TaxID=1082479 RepID=A0A1G7NPL9_9PROT|nr:class I poly(R)-hydroxyalkanoic acid synthase [Limimonas halophila]SDF75922.1 polyhydroxyalkanoate synthase [Limimonas halophila]
MAEQQGGSNESPEMPDAAELARTMANIATKSQELARNFLSREKLSSPLEGVDPFTIANAYAELGRQAAQNPEKVVEAQFQFWQQAVNLWGVTAKRMLGGERESVVEPDPSDRRFKDESWAENPMFDHIKQSYLLSAQWLLDTVNDIEGLDQQTAKKVDFYTRQFVDALSPSNFMMTNPEVLRTTVETGGQNLLDGLENLLQDMEQGRISQTDYDAFEVGTNLAVTPGKVIYQNELMQLIQYSPSTEEVYKTPLLIIPPWINKYYILDLREKNSYVKWCVDQGYTVFMISWVNPDEKLAQKSFEDYMREGPLAALDVVEEVTGEKQTNVIGYCLGGTLLACTLSYLDQHGQSDRVKASTFFTTMVDFSEAGELEVFIDEEQIQALENKMAEQGYLEGSAMATTFNMLRANDLIWSFVVNNYLLGKEPFPFDLLYWNSDSTRMPAAMHSFYLRKMYLENKLIEPGGIELLDTPIDLRAINQPSFVLATKEDHIAPWKSGYALTQHLKGSVRFVLAASGHIAGVVNPPAKQKYCYWTNAKNPKDPDTWLKNATEHKGSWWPEWHSWCTKTVGTETVTARQPGGGVYTPIEDAPGSYVKMKGQS